MFYFYLQNVIKTQNAKNKNGTNFDRTCWFCDVAVFRHLFHVKLQETKK